MKCDPHLRILRNQFNKCSDYNLLFKTNVKNISEIDGVELLHMRLLFHVRTPFWKNRQRMLEKCDVELCLRGRPLVGATKHRNLGSTIETLPTLSLIMREEYIWKMAMVKLDFGYNIRNFEKIRHGALHMMLITNLSHHGLKSMKYWRSFNILENLSFTAQVLKKINEYKKKQSGALRMDLFF